MHTESCIIEHTIDTPKILEQHSPYPSRPALSCLDKSHMKSSINTQATLRFTHETTQHRLTKGAPKITTKRCKIKLENRFTLETLYRSPSPFRTILKQIVQDAKPRERLTTAKLSAEWEAHRPQASYFTNLVALKFQKHYSVGNFSNCTQNDRN